jgi:hypothetical protein
MDDQSIDALVAWVERQPCVVEPGLSDDEVRLAEAQHGIRFPTLWKAVLQRVHPVAVPEPPRRPDGVLDWTRWPDWRMRDREMTRFLLETPADGVLFDVERNGFWWHDWGPRPTAMTERLAAAGRRLAELPQLVPVCGHWFIGQADDSPVFSIVQTDLWVPAVSIACLATGEGEGDGHLPYPIGDVPFWSRLHAWSQIGAWGSYG